MTHLRLLPALSALVIALACALPVSAALATSVYVGADAGISVLNSATNQVTRKGIDPGTDTTSVVASPDGSRLYAINQNLSSVAVIAAESGQVLKTITLGQTLDGLVVTPDGADLLVAREDSGFQGTLITIDTATDEVVGTPVAVGRQPLQVAVTPDGKAAYVTNGLDASVSAVTLASGQTTTIPVGEVPTGIAVTPDGSRAYVVVSGANVVKAIDTATKAVVGEPIAAGQAPQFIAISRDGTRAYVTDFFGARSVSVLDLAAGKALSQGIEGLTGPTRIAVDGDRGYVVQGVGKNQTVAAVDLADNSVLVKEIAVDGTARSIAVDPGLDRPPAAAFAAPATRARPGVPVAFDAGASQDPDGVVASFAWSFGDGATAALAAPRTTHTYAAPGTYTVSLAVSDEQGCSTALLVNLCSGSPGAATSRQVTVAFPGVRVACPRSARPGCKLTVRAIVKKPRKGKRPQAESAVAKAKLGRGKSAIVALTPTAAFQAKLAAATKVLVVETETIGRARHTRFRTLPVVQ